MKKVNEAGSIGKEENWGENPASSSVFILPDRTNKPEMLAMQEP